MKSYMSMIDNACAILHKWFEDESHQYGEFESSDVEYFVGVFLYNHFAFEKALDTMKTMDIAYDFIESSGDVYDEVQSIVKSIHFKDDLEALDFLQSFTNHAKSLYESDALYLINRFEYHVDAMAERYKNGVEAQKVDFERLSAKDKMWGLGR